MTNQDIYDYVMERIDKTGSPYFDEKSISDLFNESYYKWIDEMIKFGEINEQNKRLLGGLTTSKDFANTKTFYSEDIHRVWAIFGNWKHSCDGLIRTIPIVPKSWDRLGITLTDPHEQPTDLFPIYVYKDETYTIYSTTTPMEIEVVYIKRPILVDIVNKPNDKIEVHQDAIYQIVDLTVMRIGKIIENNYLIS